MVEDRASGEIASFRMELSAMMAGRWQPFATLPISDLTPVDPRGLVPRNVRCRFDQRILRSWMLLRSTLAARAARVAIRIGPTQPTCPDDYRA